MISLRTLLVAGACAGLSACSGTGSDFCNNTVFGTAPNCSGTTTGTTTQSDTVTSVNITSVQYNQGDDTLTINGAAFDGFGTYARDTTLDRQGFRGYRNTAGQRDYVAMYGTSTSGEILMAITGTPDYRDSGDLIGAFERIVDVAVPITGFADYTGEYVGQLLYVGSQGGITHTTGDFLLNVDFVGRNVEGFITNRTAVLGDQVPGIAVSGAGTQDLPNVILNRATIADNGLFTGGTATTFVGGQEIETGTYAGILGGPNATEVGGWIDIEGQDLDSDANLGTREIGIFKGTCDATAPGTLC